jgi:hypothetical protein
MKKALIAGLLGLSVLFVACGPKGEDADKKKADSIRVADSIAKVKADSAAAAAATPAVDTTKVDSAKVEAPKVEEKKK